MADSAVVNDARVLVRAAELAVQIPQGVGRADQLPPRARELVEGEQLAACLLRHPVWPIVALQRRMRFSARLAGFYRIRWHQRRARRAERASFSVFVSNPDFRVPRLRPNRRTGCAFYLFIRVMEITDILSQNVPLEDVQYLAGHSNPSGHTPIYDRRRQHVTRNIVERVSI